MAIDIENKSLSNNQGMSRRQFLKRAGITIGGVALASTVIPGILDSITTEVSAAGSTLHYKGTPTNAERNEAAIRAMVARLQNQASGGIKPALVPAPGGTPDYFGIYPNYANSPLPTIDVNGNVVAGTGIRKFVDTLPGLGAAGANNLGQYISVAHPDTITYSGSDYYEIAAIQYKEKMHSDLPATPLREYVQLNFGTSRRAYLEEDLAYAQSFLRNVDRRASLGKECRIGCISRWSPYH